MRFKNLHLRLKIISVRKFLIRSVRRKSRTLENGSRQPWMNHVTHGYCVVELKQTWATPRNLKEVEPIVVQREQTEDHELWFFGVFDDVGIAEDTIKLLQTDFFNKLYKESNVEEKCKKTMKIAHLKAMEGDAGGRNSGSAWATVIDGERVVMGSRGGYRAVVCRDGKAYQICRKPTPKWPRLWLWPWPLLKYNSGKGGAKVEKSMPELGDGSVRIDSETEFVILASCGVWEVMKEEEAVNLIRHIENAQAAAECLANEALIRMSKTIVSCLIIRFH